MSPLNSLSSARRGAPALRTTAAAATALAAAALVFSQGCAVGPDAPPELGKQPARFTEIDAPESRTESAVAERSHAPLITAGEAGEDYAFWNELQDPLLTSLVEEALAENRDVAQATARIRESRAVAGVAESYLYPEIDGNAAYSYTRISRRSAQLSRLAPSTAKLIDPDAEDWRASLSMAYELDLWGRLRRGREAAIDDLLADVEARRALGLSLAGDVASSYIDYRTLERRRDVAIGTIGSRRTVLDLARAREKAGLATDLDVARAESELATAEATVPEIDRELAVTEHRLSVLLGKPPGSARARIRAAGPPRALAAFPVPVGLPAQLIARRPDIREASLRLAGATARIGEAKAEMFPTVTLLGEVGVQATDVTKLASSLAVFWSAGPSLRVPLFDAFRRWDNWTATEERAGQQLHSLEGKILVAYAEVEDALAGSREEAARRDRLAKAVLASRRAQMLAEAKWKSGLVAYLDVVEAQRVVFVAEDLLADAEGRVVKSAVILAKALGGGYGAAEDRMPPVDPDRAGKDKEGT